MSSGTESKTSANTSEQSFYEAEARQLLTLGSVEEIKRFLATTSGLNHALLSSALERRAQKFSVAGKAAEARLVQFVQDILAAFIDQREPPVSQPETVVTFEDLVQAAAAAPNALRAVRLFQKHSQLLSPDAIKKFQVSVIDQLRAARPHSPPRAVRLLLCLVTIGKLLNDPGRAAQGQMLWGAYCRDEGRYAQALRRFARAEKIASRLDDPFLRISNLIGSASWC